MSSFANLFGKGFKKFSNFLWKGTSTLEMATDINISPGIFTTLPSTDLKTREDGILIPKKAENNKNSKQSTENINDFKFACLWDYNKKLGLSDITEDKSMHKLQFDFFKKIFKNNTLENIEKFSNDDTKLKSNSLSNRVFQLTYAANNPIEDKLHAIQLKNYDGYFVSVFDGHGGPDVAEFANQELHKKFDEFFVQMEDDNISETERVTSSISMAFENIEKALYLKTLEQYVNGEGKYAYMGSCVLSTLIHNNLLYVANLGDCKAKLFKRRLIDKINPLTSEISKQYVYFPVKISTTFNARKSFEQARLKETFTDSDIIVGKGVSFFVKGRLQPTRTLGDFYLKYREFNEPPQNMEQKFAKRAIKDFTGPYIDYKPEIKIFELTEDDEFLLLATDGLWDWITSQEAAEVIGQNREDKEMIAVSLWKLALKKAGERVNLKIEEVKSLPNSVRRAVHDDITILVVDLKNQVNL